MPLAALCCCMVFAACPRVASAAVGSFGSEGEAAGQLSEQPVGVAVNQASGDVYVADRGDERADAFGPEGEFLLAWGSGVADRQRRLETCTATCFEGLRGEGAGEFARLSGIAVDGALTPSNGDVYVADTNNDRVEKFEADGAFVWMVGGEVNKTEDTTPGATEAEKNVCTAASGDECQAGTSGTGAGAFELARGDVLAVDASGTLYVGDTNRVQEFSEGGAFKAEIKLPGAGSTRALGVDASKNVYALSESLPGVRKYKACASTCTGSELGNPRDASGSPAAFAVGSPGELFVTSETGTTHHLLGFDAAGHEVASFGTGTPAGEGLAYSESRKLLYVTAPGAVRLVSLPPPGPLVIAESTEDTSPTAATLTANVNPEGHEESSHENLLYHFEYGETEALTTSTPDETTSAGSFEDHRVSALAASLNPDTTYHFRVVVTNAAGETTDGPQKTFTTLTVALIDSESATHVNATGATLLGEVDTLGRPAHYDFEYGRTGAPNTVTPSGSLGAGAAPAPVSFALQDLAPSTTYDYRIVVSNELGEVAGPEHSFTTQAAPTTALIDGRAWEMVSPPDKHGVALEVNAEEGGLLQAAEDGDRLTYFAFAPIVTGPAGNRSFAYSQLLSTRGAGGWTTQDLATPQEAIEGLDSSLLSEYKAFSTDLGEGLVEPFGATPLAANATERTPYRRDNVTEQYGPLLTTANVAHEVKFGGHPAGRGEGFEQGTEFVTATPDFGDILLTSPQPLAGSFNSSERASVFEESSAGALELVSILPDRVPAAEEGQTASVGAGNRGVRNAISSDGRRVIFTTTEGGTVHLYLRDMSTDETVQLDAPAEGADNPGQGSPVFVDANVEDSKIFFVDEQRLTLGATASTGPPPEANLYMCEIVEVAGRLKCDITDLTQPVNAGERGDVLGADLGTDETGRYIYFVANGALAPGAARGDCEGGAAAVAEAQQSCNLYLHDTVTGETRLIAVLSKRDAPDWQAGFEERTQYGELTSRVSPNGRYLTFMSERSLTGYDNTDAHTGEPDEEVFLYDEHTGTLRCVSCDPSGARPVGVSDPSRSPTLLVDRGDVWKEHTLAGSIPGWDKIDDFHALYAPRVLSSNGRMFFNSPDTLVPAGSNGLENVYEYEPDEVGGCGEAGGCVALISSGTSSEESAFVDASVEGQDVFFITAAQLAPQDVDNALDIYDAHVCSAADPCPGVTPSQPAPCSSTESCRPAASPTVVFGAPATAAVSGPGNQPPTSTPAKPQSSLTRSQHLASALATCRRMRRKNEKKACEAKARKNYGPRKPVKRGKRRNG